MITYKEEQDLKMSARHWLHRVDNTLKNYAENLSETITIVKNSGETISSLDCVQQSILTPLTEALNKCEAAQQKLDTQLGGKGFENHADTVQGHKRYMARTSDYFISRIANINHRYVRTLANLSGLKGELQRHPLTTGDHITSEDIKTLTSGDTGEQTRQELAKTVNDVFETLVSRIPATANDVTDYDTFVSESSTARAERLETLIGGPTPTLSQLSSAVRVSFTVARTRKKIESMTVRVIESRVEEIHEVLEYGGADMRAVGSHLGVEIDNIIMDMAEEVKLRFSGWVKQNLNATEPGELGSFIRKTINPAVDLAFSARSGRSSVVMGLGQKIMDTVQELDVPNAYKRELYDGCINSITSLT